MASFLLRVSLPLVLFSALCACSVAPLSTWRMDELAGDTAYDSVSSNNGTITPIGAAAWGGPGLRFNSNTDVNCGSSVQFDDLFAGGATITAWIKPFNWGNLEAGRIVDRSGGLVATPSSGFSFFLSGPVSQSLVFHLAFDNVQAPLWRWTSPNNSITLGVYQHVALAFDSNNPRVDPLVWINGEQVNVSVTGDNLFINPVPKYENGADFRIGNHAAGTVAFSGDMWDVRVFKSLLNGAEVATIAVVDPGFSASPTTASPSTMSPTAAPTNVVTLPPVVTNTMVNGDIVVATAVDISAGTLAVNGSLTFDPGATLTVGDQTNINATGQVVLAGGLVVVLNGKPEDQPLVFNIVSAGSLTGQFDNITASPSSDALLESCEQLQFTQDVSATDAAQLSVAISLDKSACGLSSGAIAGLVIGLMLVVLAAVLTPLWYIQRKKNEDRETKIAKVEKPKGFVE